MSKPIETLMNEHRLIEEVLDSLEAFAKTVDKGTDDDRRSAGQFAQFFRSFADRCHHGKEEDLLFKELTKMGMPAESGPIGVMLHEHELGRSCVRRIAALADGEGPWTSEELGDFRGAASEFVPLLRAHIQKEDQILFPTAEGILTPDRVDQLNTQFDDFDRGQVGEAAHKELVELAKNLSKQWNPK
jgi:hemerythrin-like domain-containing protein